MSTPIDRRADPRATLRLRGFILEGMRTPVGCLVVDLSAGGALIIGGPALVVGSAVQLALELPTGSVRLRARVVRADKSSTGERRCGVAFYEVPARIRDIVKGAVFKALERAMYERRAS